jgi:hypothetical protein
MPERIVRPHKTLALVNLVLHIANLGVNFPIGLGMSELLAALVPSLELWARIFTATLALGLIGTFAAFGYFARLRQPWALIAGTVLYVLDTVLWAAVGDWISVIFHAVILFFLIRGIIPLFKRA